MKLSMLQNKCQLQSLYISHSFFKGQNRFPSPQNSRRIFMYVLNTEDTHFQTYKRMRRFLKLVVQVKRTKAKKYFQTIEFSILSSQTRKEFPISKYKIFIFY